MRLTSKTTGCYNLPMPVKHIANAVEKRQQALYGRLEELVRQESPSEDKGSVDAAATLVAGWAAGMGGRDKWHKQKHFGDVLELRFGSSQGPRVLLLGHLDSVWPLGTLKSMAWRAKGGRFYGPGVLDMKAGVAMALTALSALSELKIDHAATLLLNSDEEVGSPVSRAITEKLAAECAAVFVLEPAQGLAYKTARKGVGQYNLRVTGVAAHSGVDFEKGHSAVLEMARLVQTVAGFTDLSQKRTVNCGVLSGGTRSNVVPEHAYAEVDVRIAKASDAARVDRLFRGLKCQDPHCTLEVTGGINRPPMERTAGTVKLFRRAQEFAGELGFALEEASTGGGSDGNFTAALGIPTLDGMGAVGEGAHAAHESVVIEHLMPRTALLAAMIGEVVLRFGEEREGAGDGQSDDVVEAAFDARDPAGGVALDAVGAGLVHWLAGGEVVDELVFRNAVESDLRDFDVAETFAATHDSNSREDLMGAAGEKLKHAARVGLVYRLAEDLAVAEDTGVGGEDDERSLHGMKGLARSPDGFRLLLGESKDEGGGGFVGFALLGDIGCFDGEGEAGLGEEFTATGRD